MVRECIIQNISSKRLFSRHAHYVNYYALVTFLAANYLSRMAGALREHIHQEKVELPQICSQRSLVRAAATLFQPYLFICLAILLANTSVVLAAIFLLLSQRSLQVLVHDSAHHFFSDKDVLNDRIANFTVAGLVGMTVENYRKVHFQHHAANGSAEDPEYTSFQTMHREGGILKVILRYVFMLESLRLVKKYYFSGTQKSAAGRSGKIANFIAGKYHIVFCQMLLLSIFVLSGFPYLYAVWVYLAVSWSPLLSRLRFIAEHPGRNDLTVTTRSVPMERAFFAPLGFNYHFEHHCWPKVLPYRLGHLHASLAEKGFFDRHPQYLSKGFIASILRQRREGAHD